MQHLKLLTYRQGPREEIRKRLRVAYPVLHSPKLSLA
jgi:hypothetical protein